MGNVMNLKPIDLWDVETFDPEPVAFLKGMP
jgi:hypothetical protein